MVHNTAFRAQLRMPISFRYATDCKFKFSSCHHRQVPAAHLRHLTYISLAQNRRLACAATRQESRNDVIRTVEGSHVETCDALIVGAGPAGLGLLLQLAHRQKDWNKVVLIEKRPSPGKPGR